MKREAVFADKKILELHKACASPADGLKNAELDYNCWTFSSMHTKICDSSIHKLLAKRIEITLGEGNSSNDSDNIEVNGKKLRIPPMLFLHDICSITHRKSGVQFSFDAEDALLSWAGGHTEASPRPLQIAQVPYAKSWTQRSLGSRAPTAPSSSSLQTGERSVVAASTIGDLHADDTSSGTSSTQPTMTSGDTRKAAGLWDWTYLTDYCCTLSSPQRSTDSVTVVSSTILSDSSKTTSAAPTSAVNVFYKHQHTTNSCTGDSDSKGTSSVSKYTSSEAPPAHESCSWCWTRAQSSGLDTNLLRQTNVPILMFDELTLYRDDLEDCGEAVFDAKLRVMPTFWFLLSRMFVRVDDAVVKVRETRFFHAFSSINCTGPAANAIVHVVVTWKELRAEDDHDLWMRLKPHMLNPAAITEHLPIVNEMNNIHEFYTLTLFNQYV